MVSGCRVNLVESLRECAEDMILKREEREEVSKR